MIEAKELKKVYKTKKGVVVKALDGVSLKLPDTGMVFILGKSGSGKSTLLNVLGGLDSFDSGEIIIKGTSAKDFKQSHYDSYRNTYIGFIFQEYNILEELTVGANIALAIELQDRRATDEEVNAILAEVDLEGYGSRKPNELSGGQKQRVAIARALVKKPEIIMADEPTGALDSATGKQVFDTLKKLSKDKLVLIVSHDREFSEQYADRIIELKDGLIISDVEKEEKTNEAQAQSEESIVYSENEILVKAGYVITEEDRVAINEYLSSLSSGAAIKPGYGKKRVTSKDFKPTDEAKIKSDKSGDFKLIKSKLSIKNAFRLGSSALKYKKIRLAITIFLSLIAFTLFGVSDTIAAYNSISTTTNSIFDTGVDYASYVKEIKYVSDDYEYWSTNDTLLTAADIENIKRETGRNVIGVYKRNTDLSYSGHIGDEGDDNIREIYASEFSGLASADAQTFAELGFELLGNSRIPAAGENEIVITKYAYEFFEKSGFIDYTENGMEEFEIKEYNDLIGKKLNLDIEYNDSNAFCVVGIVDTHFDLSRYEPLADENREYTMNFIELMTLISELESAQYCSFACVGFVNSSLIDHLIEQNKGLAESLGNRGQINLYVSADDITMDENYGIVFDEDILSNMNFYYYNSLENVKQYVSWTGDPIDKLEHNQIILPAFFVNQFVINRMIYPEAYYNSDALSGIEKTMYEKSGMVGTHISGLQSIFGDLEYFTAFAYALQNYSEARAAVIDYCVTQLGYTKEDAETLYQGDAVYSDFINLVNSGQIQSEAVSEKNINEYVSGVISRYNLTEYLFSDATKDAMVKTFVYDGVEYTSYNKDLLIVKFQFENLYRDLVARHYAATYFEDALKYYNILNTEHEIEHMTPALAERVISEYSYYLISDRQVDGFEPSADVSFKKHSTDYLAGIYTTLSQQTNNLLEIYSYSMGSYSTVNDVEIVGFISDEAPDVTDRYSYRAVVSDGIIDSLVGTNRGGVFMYAVGAMPESKGEIRDIVRFSKNFTLMDGTVRYHLTNNVTGQIDMAEEILTLLGRIFLYVGIGFALFASLMLANFISTSIAYKKQDIGILRAIGSRSGDVFRIFFAESFIIAMINYVLSIIGTVTLTAIINNILREDAGMLITFLSFGIRQIVILLLVSLAVAVIATFLPVKKIASMKPIDAIKNRK